MRIVIDMEIEAKDYGGKEFKKEIEKLIADIDPCAILVKFKMREKVGLSDPEKDIDWEKEGVYDGNN